MNSLYALVLIIFLLDLFLVTDTMYEHKRTSASEVNFAIEKRSCSDVFSPNFKYLYESMIHVKASIYTMIEKEKNQTCVCVNKGAAESMKIKIITNLFSAL